MRLIWQYVFKIYFRLEHKLHERGLFPKTFAVKWAVQAAFFRQEKNISLLQILTTVNVDLCPSLNIEIHAQDIFFNSFVSIHTYIINPQHLFSMSSPCFTCAHYSFQGFKESVCMDKWTK